MIYYFSATGNSWTTAHYLAEKLQDSTFNISDAKAGRMATDDERIGFVFPVYCYDVPAFIQSFLRTVELSPKAYIYTVLTSGGGNGNAMHSVKKIFEKRGHKLAYINAVTLPDNTARLLGGQYNMSTLNHQKAALDQIASEILAGVKNTEGLAFKASHKAATVVTNAFLGRASKTRYASKEICTNCGVCEQVCSRNNIKREAGNVVFGKDCVNCLACVHWCPTAAIKHKNNVLTTKEQYHHPDVTIKEMIHHQYEVMK